MATYGDAKALSLCRLVNMGVAVCRVFTLITCVSIVHGPSIRSVSVAIVIVSAASVSSVPISAPTWKVIAGHSVIIPV